MLMDFEKLFKRSESDEGLIVMDDLGQLLKFVISCVTLKKESLQKLNCDVGTYEGLLEKLIKKCSNATLEQLHVFGTIDSKNSVIMAQFLNCCEALMLYCYCRMKKNDEYITNCVTLFEKYSEIQTTMKKKCSSKKGGDKKALETTKVELKKNRQKIETDIKPIWSLIDCAGFLKIIFDESQSERINELKQNKGFCLYVLSVTSQKLADLETCSVHSKVKYSRSIFDSFLTCAALVYKQLDFETFVTLYENYNSDCVSITLAFWHTFRAIETTYSERHEKFMKLLQTMTFDGNQREQDADYYDTLLLEIIQRAHRILEWIFEQGKKSADFLSSSSACSIVSNLFSTLQILYGKFNSATQSRECLNWILSFAKKTSVKQKPLAASIIKLLLQCINQHDNTLLIECVAHKIASSYQYRRTLVEAECAAQNNFAIITKQTVDDAFSEFVEFIKNQIHVVEVYIKRSNSFNAYARLRGQESLYFNTCNALQSLERAICTKIIALGKSIERIASAKFPVSTRNIEKVVGLIKHYYNSLISLIKHFRKHHDIKNIDLESVGLEELIKYSKKFAACVYTIAPYIESAMKKEFSKTSKDSNAKTRIKQRDAIMSKETKTIPRMIFLVETFNTQVTGLDAATKSRLSKYLHPGEVREFHIKNSVLNEVSDQDDNDDSVMSESKENSSCNSSKPENKGKNHKKRLSSSSSEEEEQEEEEAKEEEDEESDSSDTSEIESLESDTPPLRERSKKKSSRVVKSKGKAAATGSKGRTKK
jgi:hypothetical protein